MIGEKLKSTFTMDGVFSEPMKISSTGVESLIKLKKVHQFDRFSKKSIFTMDKPKTAHFIMCVCPY